MSFADRRIRSREPHAKGPLEGGEHDLVIETALLLRLDGS
jgi:hypothetical protein